jgi:hypothetical protein
MAKNKRSEPETLEIAETIVFVVVSNLNHDGQNYIPGETLELTEEQAALIPWAITKIKDEADSL